MDQVNLLAKKLLLVPQNPRSTFLVAAIAFSIPLLAQAQSYGPNIFDAGSFDNVEPTYVPWAGVDGQGNLHGIDGKQIAVDDAGKLQVDNYGRGSATFGPSIACADLNGDGKPDLVVADSFGYFWFYPNSGSAAKPVFTQGEIIPIWLGEDRVDRDTEGVDNIVPRIQLIDIDGSRKLSIVAGTYTGKLFCIPNLGNSSQPVFKATVNPDQLLINTHKHGVLWCNYLSPFLTSAFNNQNRLDLLMGEGTYSANSIYLLRNTNSSGNPAYDEDHLKKLIPGMGLEQITPVVVDWNNDGKPDVLCGDRTGYLDLFLNNSSDIDHPSFDPPVHVKIAGQEQFGSTITVSIADMSENGLPNLLIGKGDGTINYAVNTGKPGAPVFLIPPTPLKGVLPPEYHYTSLKNWEKKQAYGVPYEIVGAVNPQLEPGFTFPEGEKTKYALKFFVWPFKSTYFPDRYYPPVEDQWRQHVIACPDKITIQLNKRYRVHFWAKADRNTDLGIRLSSVYKEPDKFTPPPIIDKKVGVGTNWSECSADVRIDNTLDKTTDWEYTFDFRFTGQPTLYIDDLQIQESL